MNREDPYASSGGLFKSGPISSFLLFGLRVLLLKNDVLFFNLVMLLNLVGMVAFIGWFSKYFKISNLCIFVCNSIIICSSFTREMFVTGQLTGLLFGFLALLAYLSKQACNNKSAHAQLWLICLTTIIIDLKPNIFLLPFLAIILIYKCSILIKALVTIPALYILSLYGLSVWTNTNLFASWIANLNGINDYTKNNTLYGSKNIWQVINTLVSSNIQPNLFSVIPGISYLTVGIIGLLLVGKSKTAIGISLTLISPFFYSYFHFYSFFPIALVFTLYFFQNRNLIFLGIFLSTILVSYKVSDNLIVLFIAAISVAFVLFTEMHPRDTFLFVSGWLLSIPMRIYLLKLVQDEIKYMSILLSLLMMIWLIETWRLNFFGKVNIPTKNTTA
jgi:hypothetical protein